jgi:hypothetical protein
MPDKKRRFYRLLETYMNESRKEDVELMYGKDAKIKVHNWTHNVKGDQFIFENCLFNIVSIDRKRIKQIKVTIE